MRRALELAALGSASTQPNPRVGCVIASGERIVGEGWHERAGGPHAEVFALRAAGPAARGATAYVTLEPCSHHGRTPPCATALIEAGIARVVCAMTDPDPRVDGRGVAALRAHGIAVETGLMEGAARELNVGFISRVTRGRPWLRLKMAASMDGRSALAGGQSQWITSEAARNDVQQLRAQSAAVLSAIGTVLADDPSLDVRIGPEPRRQPLRVVLDSHGRMPEGARLLQRAGPVLLLGASAPPWFGHVAGGRAGLSHEAITLGADGHVELAAALQRLGALGINEVWVEAGATLGGALLAAGLVDELVLYLAPTLLGPAARPLAQWPQLDVLGDRPRWQVHDLRTVGPDVRIMLRPESPQDR